MEIKISPTKKIVTDSANWIYCEKVGKKEKEHWASKWFYPDLKTCYYDLLDSFTKISDKKTLKEAFKQSVEKLEGINKELRRCMSQF